MVEQGVLLSGKKEDAQVVVEVAMGAYGTDERDCKAGLPQLGMVPTMFGRSGGNRIERQQYSCAQLVGDEQAGRRRQGRAFRLRREVGSDGLGVGNNHKRGSVTRSFHHGDWAGASEFAS